MEKKPNNINDVVVRNVPPERTNRTLEAIRLRKQGRSYQEIADTINVSKSTAYRLVNDAISSVTTNAKGEVPSETVKSDYSGFIEPPEFLDDVELKRLSKRVKQEVGVYRDLARKNWLQYVANNPQAAYQYHMQRDGGSENREIRELRDDIKSIKDDLRKKSEGSHLIEALKVGVDIAKGQERHYDPFQLAGSYLAGAQKLLETIAETQGNKGWTPEEAIRYEQLKGDLESKRMLYQQVGKGLQQGLGVVRAIADAKLGGPRRNTTRIKCPKCEGIVEVPIPAPPSVVCPSCGQVLTRAPPQTQQNEEELIHEVGGPEASQQG